MVTQGLQISPNVSANADRVSRSPRKSDVKNSAKPDIKETDKDGSVNAEAAYSVDLLSNVKENVSGEEMQTMDEDTAEKLVSNSKVHILAQADQSVLAQANQTNHGAMALLG